jgi:DNA-binding NarL/FixJ family response regulator
MGKSILNDKRILVVDNNPTFLLGLEEEIQKIAPNCHCDEATHYKKAAELLASFTYDLVILDSLSVQSSDLLGRIVTRFPPSPVVLLTSRYLDPEVLEDFVKMGVRIYPPKENFREIISFLEDVVRNGNLPGWRHLLQDLTGLLTSKIKSGWQEKNRIELKSTGGTEGIF